MLERIVRLYDKITQVFENRNFRKYADHHLTMDQLEIIKKKSKLIMLYFELYRETKVIA